MNPTARKAKENQEPRHVNRSSQSVRAGLVALSVFAIGCLHAMAQPAGTPSGGELDAMRLVGRAHYENDEFDKAAEIFRQCTSLAPDSAMDQLNLGIVLVRSRKYDEAIVVLDRAESLDGDAPGVHYLRGIVFKRQGKHAEAAASLNAVIASDPECGPAYYNLGVCSHLSAPVYFLVVTEFPCLYRC